MWQNKNINTFMSVCLYISIYINCSLDWKWCIPFNTYLALYVFTQPLNLKLNLTISTRKKYKTTTITVISVTTSFDLIAVLVINRIFYELIEYYINQIKDVYMQRK